MQAPRYGHSPYRTQPLARDQPNATASITTEPELTQQRTPTELDTTVPRSSTFNPVLQDSQTCWICLDSDDDFEAVQGGNPPAREWVHACNCTLVAHSDVSEPKSHCAARYCSCSARRFNPTVLVGVVLCRRRKQASSTVLSSLRNSVLDQRGHFTMAQNVQTARQAVGQG